MNEAVTNREAREALAKDYEWGFSSDIEQEFAPKGLNEDTVRFISAKKGEPEWMLEWRLKAYRAWLEMEEVDWAKLDIPEIDYQDAYYYAAPKAKPKLGSLDEVDPEILRVYEKLGIPIEEQKVLAGVEGARKVAVDAVFDSVSVATTFREELKARRASSSCRSARRSANIPSWSRNISAASCRSATIISPASTARSSPTAPSCWCPRACAARWSCRTYFRINAENTGQFERTLIVAEKGSYVSYLEGCTAPMRDENQLHAAVVEIYAHEDAEVKYSTVQNWYPGDAEGKGGIFNFVTKRALCAGRALEGQLDPGRDRQRDHLEISELHSEGRGQRRRILFGRADQQPPAGRHRHQDGPHRRGHALDHRLARASAPASRTTPIAGWCGCFRARRMSATSPSAIHCCWAANAARTPCPISRSRTRPRPSSMRRPRRRSARTSCSTPDARGLDAESAVALIVNGFAREVLKQLPMEFAVEAQKLLGISLEGSVG